MTTDAKIGLLLALVFIVAITFVINGLPDFLNKKDKNELTGNYINHYSKPDEPGIVDRTSREAAAVLNRKVVSVPIAPATETNTVQPTQESNYQTILPAASQVVKSSMPESAAPQKTAVQTAAPTATGDAAPVTAAPAVVSAKDSEPVAKPGEKIYQVADGDSLVSIAQKFYGQKAGNKYSNILKIYEANKGTMKSIDKLQVGQKLVIPSLTQKEQVLVGSGLFEKIDNQKNADAAKKTNAEKSAEVKTQAKADAKTTDAKAADAKTSEAKPADAKPAKPAAVKETKTYKEYVVKENDTLWKIAARNLGDGNRFNEIASLNRNINPDNLVVGTKIKLPAK
jgi:nucleoid-associated protein YgaU